MFRLTLLICYLMLGAPASTIFKAHKTSPVSSLINPDGDKAKHPLHLSSTELNFNAKTSTIEVSCRIFTDDFEDLLGKKYKIKPDLSSAARHKDMDKLVNTYMSGHLQLAPNGKTTPLKYLGYENDNEAIIVFMESGPVKGVKKLDTTCTVLYDLYDDQTNIFHVTFNGNRKSAKLTYPDKVLTSNF